MNKKYPLISLTSGKEHFFSLKKRKQKLFEVKLFRLIIVFIYLLICFEFMRKN